MNHNPSPKTELLKSPEVVKRHAAFASDDWLRAHLKIALQEMQYRASAGTDPQNFNMCAASLLRLMGAQEFVETFLNLAEAPTVAAKSDSTNLPGNVTSLNAGRKN